MKKADGLVRQGRLDAAIDEYVRLIQQQPQDWGALNLLGDLYARAGRNDKAVEQYTRIADYHFAEGFFPKAQALYKKALKCHPDHKHTLRRLAEIATKQGLLANARQYLQLLGEHEELPQRRTAPAAVAEPTEPVTPPRVPEPETPSASTNAVAVPASSIPDAGLTATPTPTLPEPSASGQPSVPPPAVSAAEDAAEAVEIDLTEVLGTLLAVEPTPTVEAPAVTPAPAPAAAPAPLLDAVFAELRVRAADEQGEPSAGAQYEVALHLLRDGQSDEAIAALEAAAQSPAFQFKAGSQLARLLVARGNALGAIDWFERALDGAAPSPAARAAALYDLADALEGANQPARALAVLLELDADLPSFRDVDERLARLKSVQAAAGTA